MSADEVGHGFNVGLTIYSFKTTLNQERMTLSGLAKQKSPKNYKQLLDEVFFCDIQNNQGRGRGYQPKPKADADNPYL